MKQKIRIEMNVEFTPTININDFRERFVSAVEKVAKDLAKESHTKYEFTEPTTVSVSNKNYDRCNNLDTQPMFFFDV